MIRTIINWTGLVLVGASAAILTFTTLRELAQACGFHGWLGWLLPISVDAAAAVATSVWLGGKDSPEAVRFARTWALTAAGVSLLGNATQHGLAAYGTPAPWWVAVAVAVVPPLALVGTTHLMVLLSNGRSDVALLTKSDQAEPGSSSGDLAEKVPAAGKRGLDQAQPAASGHNATYRRAEVLPSTGGHHPGPTAMGLSPIAEQLIEQGAGRRRIAKVAGISEHAARQLLAASRNGTGQ